MGAMNETKNKTMKENLFFLKKPNKKGIWE
jgi:hypothetical protein